MAFYQFQREQFIKASINEVWEFISSPQNLKKITPEKMGFDILTPNLSDKIYEGMIILYRISPLAGIPINWVTEITHVRDKSYFVDEQKVGPYRIWNHQHIILLSENGVLMKDIVSYKPPFGLLCRISNALFIKNKLTEIFDYRRKVLEEIFPL